MTEPELTLQDFRDLLDLYLRVCLALDNVPLPARDREILTGLIVKLLFHAGSALQLAKGTWVEKLSSQVDYIDHSSIAVLARAALETYATLNYIFADPRNRDEQEFRACCAVLRGLRPRQRFPASEPNSLAQKAEDEKWIAELRQEVMKTRAFRGLSQKEQAKVLEGRYEPRKMDLIQRAGFGQNTTDTLYGWLSDHSHSGYLSILQISQSSGREKQSDLARVFLWQIGIVLSKAIELIEKLFPIPHLILAVDTKTVRLARMLAGLSDFADEGFLPPVADG